MHCDLLRSIVLNGCIMGDNEMILGAVHRSPGICLTAEENPRKKEGRKDVDILLYTYTSECVFVSSPIRDPLFTNKILQEGERVCKIDV